jgi:hypothetical protein
MREVIMRTTLTLDDDVLSAAKALAEQRNETIGGVISDLVRQALTPASRQAATRNGVPLLPNCPDGGPVTLETVNALRDELP